MESFDLFSYCILSGVKIDFLKELMILFFLPPPTIHFHIQYFKVESSMES